MGSGQSDVDFETALDKYELALEKHVLQATHGTDAAFTAREEKVRSCKRKLLKSHTTALTRAREEERKKVIAEVEDHAREYKEKFQWSAADHADRIAALLKDETDSPETTTDER